MENRIHELIEKFDFTELSKEEEGLVLAEMTIEDYSEMRNAVSLAKNFFDEEPKLMSEDLVVPVIKKESVLVRMVNYKLPIYKVAAILMIVLSIDHLVPAPEEVGSCPEIAENSNEFGVVSDTFLSYNRYASNNSIKYDTGLSRVNY